MSRAGIRYTIQWHGTQQDIITASSTSPRRRLHIHMKCCIAVQLMDKYCFSWGLTILHKKRRACNRNPSKRSNTVGPTPCKMYSLVVGPTICLRNEWFTNLDK